MSDEMTYVMHLVRLETRATYRWNNTAEPLYHVDFSMHKDEFNRRDCPGKIEVTVRS